MSDCPGRFKCHGPSGWCDECGDVDLICDDSRCDVHKRGGERFDELQEAEARLLSAKTAFEHATKEHEAARRAYERWQTGNPVMVIKVRTRCVICGWPLKDKIEDGCTADNCSMRMKQDRRA